MRYSINFLASLLLIILFFLFNETQGIRLGNRILKPVELLEKRIEMEIPLVVKSLTELTLCKLHCNSGNSRRLLIVTSPSSPTTSARRKEEVSVKEQKLNNNSEAGFVDLAEMDYSPAARKPPIHN